MNNIVCKIYDFDIDKKYDGVILENKIHLLDNDGEAIDVKKIVCSLVEHSIGSFYIDENDFDDIGEDKENYRWGYFYGGDGRITILPLYEEGYPFEEGYACVKVDGKYGFIDFEGNEIIEPIYDYTDIWFRGGLCAAKKNGKFGYIDKKGKEKIKFKFEFASEFIVSDIIKGKEKMYAIVKEDGLYGIIDIEGNYLVNPIYEELKMVFFEDLLIGRLDGKYGVLKVTYNKELEKIYVKYIAEHIFHRFGNIISSRQVENETYFYSMCINNAPCIINKELEVYFGEEDKEYVPYKEKKILVPSNSFSEYNSFRYRKFRGEAFC